MGRRAKAFSLAEKKAQARTRQHERRLTTQYVIFPIVDIQKQVNVSSSKALISTQRYVAYWRNHGRQGSSQRNYLPKDLVALALQELPIHSTFFQDASKSAEMLDETGMDDWDGGPPYVTGPPSGTPREVQFTERMKEVVHGRRVRLQKDEEIVWQQLTVSDLTVLLHAAIDEWEVGRLFLTGYEDGHRERAMAEVWLQWVARRAYNLHSEISYYHRS